jgi:hypothetical protein
VPVPINPPTSRKSKSRSTLRSPLALAAMVAVYALAGLLDASARAGSHGSGVRSSAVTSSRSGKSAATFSRSRTTDRDHGHPRRPMWKRPVPSGVATVDGVAAPMLGIAASIPGGQNFSGPSKPSTLRVGIPPADERRYAPDQVLVELSGAQSRELNGILQRHGLTEVETLDRNGGTLSLLRITDRRPVPTVLRALAGEGVVAWAQPNYVYTTQEQVR